MPDLLVGALVDDDDFPALLWAQNTTQITDIADTTPTAGSPTVDGTFVAPTTGRIIVIVGGGFRSPDANRIFVVPYIWLGTGTGGTLFLDGAASGVTAQHGVGGVNQLSRYAHFSRRSMVSGLTPGSTYFAQVRYYVTGGSTADLRNRDLLIRPST